MKRPALSHFFPIIIGIILLTFTATYASDPNGTWSSSTGSTVKLWANMQTVSVTVTTPQGQSYKYNGWWTRFSDYFAYQTHDGINNCSFVNANSISVKMPKGGITTWTRGVAPKTYAPPQQQSNSGITGNWKSSSGSLVQVSVNGNQIQVTLVDQQGRRHQGIGRWIQYGSKFDYSIAGFNGAAQCTVVSANRIDVYFGKWTTWTR